MTNKGLLDLYNGLLNVANYPGVKFAYAVARNINKIKPEIESLQKTNEPSEDFVKYDTERVELAKTMANKDDQGNPILENGSYKMDEDTRKAFEKALEPIKEKYAVAVEARDAQIKEVDALLDAEAPQIEFHKIEMEHLPEDITAQKLVAIEPIIIQE